MKPIEAVQPSPQLLSPIQQLPAHDYGAETLRNYRYQSAYAVALLVAAAAKKKKYSAVWCEQEDDILAQIAGHTFTHWGHIGVTSQHATYEG